MVGELCISVMMSCSHLRVDDGPKVFIIRQNLKHRQEVINMSVMVQLTAPILGYSQRDAQGRRKVDTWWP